MFRTGVAPKKQGAPFLSAVQQSVLGAGMVSACRIYPADHWVAVLFLSRSEHCPCFLHNHSISPLPLEVQLPSQLFIAPNLNYSAHIG